MNISSDDDLRGRLGSSMQSHVPRPRHLRSSTPGARPYLYSDREGHAGVPIAWADPGTLSGIGADVVAAAPRPPVGSPAWSAGQRVVLLVRDHVCRHRHPIREVVHRRNLRHVPRLLLGQADREQ